MQIPILNGIYADENADFRTSYPVNLVPVPKDNGISKGYLRPADGISYIGDGPGNDRGAINWNGVLYRVMGSKLVTVDALGSYTVIGDVGNDGKQVTLDYSFVHLAIASNKNLFLYDGTTLAQVTDPDLGDVLDVKWVDGYFMTTDGEFLVITELSDPFVVYPTKYGSSEASPDPIEGLLKLRNEIYAINRNSIEVFDNVGASGFPFQRITSAHIDRGAVGTHASSVFMGAIAFLGGSLNEPISVWIGANGQTQKISDLEIDTVLRGYSELQLSQVVMETKVDKNHEFLYIHLPDKTLVYDGIASQLAGVRAWHILASGIEANGQYKARNFVFCYDRWICADPSGTRIGVIDESISSQYGDKTGWEFGTTIIYNQSNGAIFHELELVSLTGRVAFGDDPTISTSYSLDGETWSVERYISAGKFGDRNKRLVWFRQGNMGNYRIQRFKGTSDAHISISRLEARIEGLNE